ncbi:unnamed protein product [Adineta steineri]|uniref:cyclin-dependent kinase n=1 Tax=Adineta steineri TaxID=433720 RepID=A0A818H5V8_9BILA|nr:unnamed protein product [Adineta steineri]CAF3501306.1 unnamed protein product [Adineta steineri]
MEVGSTIAKVFKRFTIPRSTSAMGSFTTSNGTANNTEPNPEETTTATPPTSSSSSNHKHPPLSYVQNIRLIQQHNLTDSSPQQHSTTPPLRENISSVIVYPSTDQNTSKKSKIDTTNKKSNITHDMSFDNINEISLESNNDSTNNGHHRSSIKSLFTKKSHNAPLSHSVNITPKQKKSRTSFRPFSNFLKRSQSTTTDLATSNNQSSTDQSVPTRSSQENDLTYLTRLNTNAVNNNNTTTSTGLVPISEEDNPIQNKLDKISVDVNNSNSNHQVETNVLTQQQVSKTIKSLSASSSSSPPSGTSSVSTTKYPNVNNQPQQRDEIVKPSKSSSSMLSHTGTALSILPNNTNPNKSFISNSISLHGDINNLVNNQHLSTSNTNNSTERISIHQTMSLRVDGENTNENQQVTKVKMRDHSSKKKKNSRALESRISLPPEVKNTSNNIANQPFNDLHNVRMKLTKRSSYYQPGSASIQGINDVLNQSNISLSRLSPHSTGPLSRNEHRRSMLDLGFGKIESYVKLEKLGEGTYATVYKGTSSILSGFIALKEIRLEQEEGAPCTALREVSLLKGLKHNNIVCLYDIIFDHTTLTLVFEYVEKDLKQYMEDCANILSMKNVRLFLFQLLRGLEFCHGKKILHRDLKPQNLLINERGELKLADFGLARIKSFPTKTYSNEVVTLWYRPPDVLLGSTEYSTPIDIWAVGCIFFEMACGRPLFAGTKVEEELYLIFRYLGTPTEHTLPGVTSNPDFQALRLPFSFGESLNRLAPRLDQSGIDLLQKFIRYNPHSRISARDAMMHNFFSCYPPEIHTLGPLQSILEINDVSLTKNHGSKLNAPSLMKTAISKRSSVHL